MERTDLSNNNIPTAVACHTSYTEIEIETSQKPAHNLSSINFNFDAGNSSNYDYDSDLESTCSFHTTKSLLEQNRESDETSDITLTSFDLESLVDPDSPRGRTFTFSDNGTESSYEPSVFSPRPKGGRGGDWGFVYEKTALKYEEDASLPSDLLDHDHDHEHLAVDDLGEQSLPDDTFIHRTGGSSLCSGDDFSSTNLSTEDNLLTNINADDANSILPPPLPPCLQCTLLGLRCSLAISQRRAKFSSPRSVNFCVRCFRNQEDFCIQSEGEQFMIETCFAEGIPRRMVEEKANELIEEKVKVRKWALPMASWVRRRDIVGRWMENEL